MHNIEKHDTVVNQIQRMIQFNIILQIFITCIHGLIDDLYQKSASFSKLKNFVVLVIILCQVPV